VPASVAPSSRAAFGSAPHLTEPSGGMVVWFTDPPGAVIQMARAGDFTEGMARWIVSHGVAALLERFPDPAELVLVLDLGLMDRREPPVRSLMVEAAKTLRPRLAHATVLPPDRATKIYLASLDAGVALVRVFGVSVRIGRSLSDVLREHRLQAAR
jgi:hypothetical protein